MIFLSQKKWKQRWKTVHKAQKLKVVTVDLSESPSNQLSRYLLAGIIPKAGVKTVTTHMSVYGLILSFSPLFKFQQHFWALQNTQIYSTSCSKWSLHSLVWIQENCSKKKRISGSLRVRPEVIPKIHQQTKEASRQQHELELKIKAPERSIPSTSLQANFFVSHLSHMAEIPNTSEITPEASKRFSDTYSTVISAALEQRQSIIN